jgi:hypothetical protein
MKTTIKNAVLIGLIFTCFFSCNKTDQSNLGPSPVIDTLGCNGHGKIRSQICQDSASYYINSYQTYIDTVKIDLKKRYPIKYRNIESSQKLNYGSATTVKEIRTLLRNTHLKDEDKVYVMNGIVKGVTETIFVIESVSRKGSIENTEDETTTTYFDFTQACPNSCPTFMN